MPVWTAVVGLPWGAILKQGAGLLVAAHELRARSQQQTAAAAASATLETLSARIDALEQRERASAELIEQLVAQTSAVTAIAHATAIKARQAFVIAIAGATLGLGAVLLALLR